MSQVLFVVQVNHIVPTNTTLSAAGNYALNEFEFSALDLVAIAAGQVSLNFSFQTGAGNQIAVFTPIAFPAAAGVFVVGISGQYRRSFPSPLLLQRGLTLNIISSGFTNCSSCIFDFQASGFKLP